MRVRWPFRIAILALALGPNAGSAAIDLTGRWIVSTSFGPLCLDIVQTGTDLAGDECVPTGNPYTGSIDLDSGAFTFGQPVGCTYIAVEATAAVFAESPSGLYCGRAGRAGFQLARLAAALKQSLAAPLAVAQPFREIYIASFTIHHRVSGQGSGVSSQEKPGRRGHGIAFQSQPPTLS